LWEKKTLLIFSKWYVKIYKTSVAMLEITSSQCYAIIDVVGKGLEKLTTTQIQNIQQDSKFSGFSEQVKQVCWYMARQTKTRGFVNEMEMVLRMLGYEYDANSPKQQKIQRQNFLRQNIEREGVAGKDFKKIGKSEVVIDNYLQIPGQTGYVDYTRKSRVWMLTERFTKKLAMRAQTDIGKGVREYYVMLQEALFDIFQQHRESSFSFSSNLSVQRLKDCESVKTLCEVVREKRRLEKIQDPKSKDSAYGVVNGETNKMVTGKYAKDWKGDVKRGGFMRMVRSRKTEKLVDEPFVLRDYMSEEQHAASTYAQMLSAKNMKRKLAAGEDFDIVEEHKNILQRFEEDGDLLHDHDIVEAYKKKAKLSPDDARKELNKLEDKKPKKSSNKPITFWFVKK
jgi:hypothetical protein